MINLIWLYLIRATRIDDIIVGRRIDSSLSPYDVYYEELLNSIDY